MIFDGRLLSLASVQTHFMTLSFFSPHLPFSLCLSHRLLICWLLDFQTVTACVAWLVHASLSVTLLLLVCVILQPVLRGEVCLVCHFIYQSCSYVCRRMWVWGSTFFSFFLFFLTVTFYWSHVAEVHWAKQTRPQSTRYSSSLSAALPALAVQTHACLQKNDERWKMDNRLCSFMHAHRE